MAITSSDLDFYLSGGSSNSNPNAALGGALSSSAITNASDTPALETLYTFTKQDDGTVTRPLGIIPTL